MTYTDYVFARRALEGEAIIIATVPVSRQRIRITELRRQAGQFQGRWFHNGEWYPIYQIEYL